jgi:hypothetical protein
LLPQDLIAFAQSTYPALRDTDAKDIYITGSGYKWEGSVELSERAWEAIGDSLSQVNINVRRGMYPLASTDVVDG